MTVRGAPVDAAKWHAVLQASQATALLPARLDLPFTARRFVATPPEIVQPPLLDDVICLHLGGAKRVQRVRDGVTQVFDVPLNAMTVMPRHRAAAWRTQGPVDYVHVTLRPKPFDALLEEEVGKRRESVELRDPVGFNSPLLAGLAEEMLRLEALPDVERLYTDSLFTAFSLALLRYHSSEGTAPSLTGAEAGIVRGGLPGFRLRAVVDFLVANRSRDISLDELTSVAGLSRAQFFRAFRQSTGATPIRYLERLRIGDVKLAVEQGETLETAANCAGFASLHTMSLAFRRVMHMTPAAYLRWYR